LPERWPAASVRVMRLTRLLPLTAAAVLAVGAGATATAAAAVTHTVRRGETLTSIAAVDGLSVSGLAAANGLSPFDRLITGRELIIPPQREARATPDASSSRATTTTIDAPVRGGYLVPRGATLTAIAERFGTSVSALAADNDMTPDEILLSGRRLNLPGDVTPTPVSRTAPAPVPAAEPTPAFVSPSQVGEIAAQEGVAPSLAEAVADQESGFNNDEVSGTGAIGVMQIEPGTWRELTGRDGLHLSADSALDNVRGGAVLLHELLGQTGGDESEAVAAYYQGLESVRARGMFRDTRQYVRDVLALQERFGG
jgi:soluble lytic murein transglycosylase-like protein